MHRDLLNWDKALQLAERFAPDELPFIAREYAQQLEIQCDFLRFAIFSLEIFANVLCRGSYGQAHTLYQQGLAGRAPDVSHTLQCRAGVARMLLRQGDIHGGVTLATSLKDKAVLRDCGDILESMGQPAEAAQLFEQAGLGDRAVAMFIKTKNWAKVAALLPAVNSPKLIVQYAKARGASRCRC
jgi:WD repeat-containing protein 19